MLVSPVNTVIMTFSTNISIIQVGGRFEKVAQPGQMLHPGTLVARLETQNGLTVTKPIDFEDSFVDWTQSVAKKSPVNMYFTSVVQVIFARKKYLRFTRKKTYVMEIKRLQENSHHVFLYFHLFSIVTFHFAKRKEIKQ